MKPTPGIGAVLKDLAVGKFETVEGRLVRGGSLQARRLSNDSIQFYWRYSQDSITRREPIGPYDPSAPPKKLEPSPKGYSVAAALARCSVLAKTHDEHANSGGLLAAKAEEQQRHESRKAAQAEAKQHSLGALLKVYVGHLEARGRSSHSEANNLFKLHVREGWPLLWKTPATGVTPDQLLDVLRRLVEAGKGRTSNKLRSYIRAAYQCAIDVRAVASIPAAFKPFNVNINPAAMTRRESRFDRADKRPLTIDQLRIYWRLVKHTEGSAASAMAIHLLSGAPRIQQFVKLKWVNTTETEFTIFDIKGRPGLGPRPHTLPLTKPAATRLKSLEREGEFVFTSNHGKSPINATTLTGWSQDLVGEAIAGFQLKRVRSGVETLLSKAKVSEMTRGHLQSHGLSGVQARHYDGNDFMEEKRGALEILLRKLNGNN